MPHILIKKRISGSKSLLFSFLLSFVLILFLGLLFLLDVSAPQGLQFFDDRFYFLKKQLFSLMLGLFVFIFFSLLNYRYLSKFSVPILFFSILLLIFLLIPGLGQRFLGAKRWLYIGSFGFQPSEIVKFSLVVYFASLIEKRKSMLSFLVPLFFISFLIMMQPDLGTTLVIATIGFAMIFVSGVSLHYFLSLGVFSIFLALIAIFASDYRRDRFLSFLNQIEDPLGKTYHINQIIISLGLGGFWGRGLGNSRQKYLFLPEAATDSIFAVIAEEIGFFGSSLLILLFVYFLYSGLRIALSTRDVFGRTLVFGFLVWIASQAFLNLGAMTAVLPLTGIPLPFFSYGGSSLISLMAAVGVIISVFINSGRDYSAFNRGRYLRRR